MLLMPWLAVLVFLVTDFLIEVCGLGFFQTQSAPPTTSTQAQAAPPTGVVPGTKYGKCLGAALGDRFPSL